MAWSGRRPCGGVDSRGCFHRACRRCGSASGWPNWRHRV